MTKYNEDFLDTLGKNLLRLFHFHIKGTSSRDFFRIMRNGYRINAKISSKGMWKLWRREISTEKNADKFERKYI